MRSDVTPCMADQRPVATRKGSAAEATPVSMHRATASTRWPNAVRPGRQVTSAGGSEPPGRVMNRMR